MWSISLVFRGNASNTKKRRNSYNISKYATCVFMPTVAACNGCDYRTIFFASARTARVVVIGLPSYFAL